MGQVGMRFLSIQGDLMGNDRQEGSANNDVMKNC